MTQRQHASDNAVAIASGRDTYVGLTADQMKDIISALASQMLLPAYAEVAREIVERRLQEFQAEVVTRFARDPKARPEAFADPDFQAMIVSAQRAHARAGEDEVRDTLVDLIASRSAQRDRTRLSLVLNEAVEKSAFLTHEEFAALSFAYVLRYVNLAGPDLKAFLGKLRQTVVPLLPDIKQGTSTLGYLEAQGCVGTLSISHSLFNVFTTS